jgi:type I restriction enzyme S subunit
MDNWFENSLEQICLIAKGEQLNKLDLAKSGDYPCINGGIEPSGYTDKWNRLENTITISEGGNSCGFVNFLQTKFWSGGHCYSLLNISDDFDTDFLYHALKGRESIIMGLRVGSGLPNIQQKAIKNFKISYPKDKTEQTRISVILSTADEAIEQTEKLIAKYQRIKTGLMQDLLTRGIDEHGNIRSKATHKFVVKNGIEIPEVWDVNIIDNVCKVTKLAGYEYTKYFDYSVGGEVIALRALNIKNEEIILDDIQTIPKKVSDLLPRSKINKGDVLITYIGAYIGDVLLIDESDKYHLAPNVSKITAGKKILPEFLEIVLKTYPVQKQTKNLTAVTATPSLTMGQIRNIIIAYPTDPAEQERIIETINSIKRSIKDEKNKLTKLNSIKNGLMQDLLSGRVRVKMEEAKIQ